MKKLFFRSSRLRSASCLVALSLASISQAQAVVEAVQIHLSGGSGSTTYTVPTGKVLIIEHVIFTDRWNSLGQDKRLILRHGGSSISGQVWDTTLPYGSNWTQLLRPLRLPEGKAISAPFLNDSAYKVFLYGRLADEGDLFAKVDTKIKDIALANNGAERQITGTVDPSVKRPARIAIEKSSDLETWTVANDTTFTSNSLFALTVPSSEPKQFLRATACLAPEEDLPPFPFFIFPSF